MRNGKAMNRIPEDIGKEGLREHVKGVPGREILPPLAQDWRNLVMTGNIVPNYRALLLFYTLCCT